MTVFGKLCRRCGRCIASRKRYPECVGGSAIRGIGYALHPRGALASSCAGLRLGGAYKVENVRIG